MAEMYYQHPSCVIMRVNMGNGQPAAIWGERMWISHVLIHPSNPDTILFCHEGGGNVKQRMWIVNAANHSFSDNLSALDDSLSDAIGWVDTHAH